MKVLVVGLGSMGKRRIKLLKEDKSLEIFGIDSNAERCAEVKEKLDIDSYASIDEACKSQKMDCALVCTSPLSHAAIISDCLDHDLHVFTEINLVQDGYEENIAKAKAKGKVLFLSSTFLYRKETQTIIAKCKADNSKINYIYHVGQYLPDWHPWESFNNYFIGNPRTNGCREIMAIDLPWIVTAFGDIASVQVLKSKNTGLNVNYNDNYLILLEHKTGAKGVFAVDVVTRKPTRHMEVFGENLQLVWDGTPDSLVEYDILEKAERKIEFSDASEHTEGYASFVTENPYREELKSFLAQVADPKKQPAWDFEKDFELLKVIDRIES